MTVLTDKILIIGCGCFGVSTAYHLLKRGYRNITLLDRSPELPAPDAASNDINRSMSNHVLSIIPITHASTLFSNFAVACSTVVRSSYPDKFYCELTREAISLWKNKAEYGDAYHE
jgi:sarcosine oxidase/L-pipecolate oxidase